MVVHKIGFWLLLVSNLNLFAQQRQTFDIATFIPPQGWQNETKDFATSYVQTNSVTGGWCRITLYKSIGSSGDAVTDFNDEWKTLVVKSFPDVVEPTLHLDEEDGWKANTGASSFQFNGQPAAASLTTISGYGVKMSLTVLTNTDEFESAIDAFSESVQMQKPVQVSSQTPQQLPSETNSAKYQPLSTAPGNNGISLATTNFDDGWVAQPFADYVKLTKANTVVLLHYSIEVTDELRKNDLEWALLNQIVAPRYNLSNIRKYDNDGPCYFCIYFYEMDAVEKSTGKSFYVGFRVITNSGVSRCIEIISPSAQEFQRTFPDQKNIESLLNYNKFAVTEKDVIGTWEESSGAAVNMYSVTTGAYAGMNTSSSANKFIFKGGGLYESTHKGAFGMVGSMQFYSQKYDGNVKVSNWEVTLTKQFEGKTKVYWAQFEAVRGGRVLHLTNKQYTGDNFHLVKTK
ncbi:MAG: hypothetical protein ACKOE6_02795 [Flammeovirgaceae bacterium]